MNKIDIASVLNHFDMTVDEATTKVLTHGIRYRKATGEMGEIYNARLNVKKPTDKTSKERRQDIKLKYNLKYSGAVLIYNQDTGEYRSIKKAHMTHFRLHNSDKWLQIWH